MGLRDREYSLDKPPGVLPYRDAGGTRRPSAGVFPAQQTVAKILGAPVESGPVGSRFEVLNAGVGNYGTVQESSSLQDRTIRAFPTRDLVILEYFINDAEPVPRGKENDGLAEPVLSGGFRGVPATIAFAARFRAANRSGPSIMPGYTKKAAPACARRKRRCGELAEITSRDGMKLLVAIAARVA